MPQNPMSDDDVVSAINRALDGLADARQSGRDVTAIPAWQRAYDQIVEHDLGDMGMAFEWVLAVAQRAESSTPEQLQTVKASYRAHRDAIITTLHAFTHPNDLPTMWSGGPAFA